MVFSICCQNISYRKRLFGIIFDVNNTMLISKWIFNRKASSECVVRAINIGLAIFENINRVDSRKAPPRYDK